MYFMIAFMNTSNVFLPMLACADPEGGGGRGSGSPLRFVRGGVLCGCSMGRRGGPKVVFISLL